MCRLPCSRTACRPAACVCEGWHSTSASSIHAGFCTYPAMHLPGDRDVLLPWLLGGGTLHNRDSMSQIKTAISPLSCACYPGQHSALPLQMSCAPLRIAWESLCVCVCVFLDGKGKAKRAGGGQCHRAPGIFADRGKT